MHTSYVRTRAGFALIAAASTLLSGCTFHQQYRTNLAACRASGADESCRNATIEDTDSYLLGFVEFDDQGWLWDRKQLDAVLKRLADDEAKGRLIIITFVHGWKHNARYDDANVQMIRDNLRIWNRLERRDAHKDNRPARRVVGVYAGWRGLSLKVPVLNNFTFWERKNTAHEVGRGALGELFTRLEAIRTASHIRHTNETNQTRLFIIGHSFGGAATYSALGSILAERAVETVDEHGNGHPPRGVGDLVMLVNPAFEAARYGVLEDIAVHQTYLTSNLVNLAIFTSKTDDATKIAFPIGRYVSTLFDRHQSGLERSANRTAVGHFTPFITHDLVATAHRPEKKHEPTEGEIEETSERIRALKAQVHQNVKRSTGERDEFTYHFTGSDLNPRTGHNPRLPLYVVSVDPKIIPDHNGIDRPEFLRFLQQFIIAFEPQDH